MANTRTEPDYVVIRRGANLPADFRIGDVEGKWFDRSALPTEQEPLPRHLIDGGPGAVAVATGRFEFRDDGVCAEVFELRL